MSLMPMRRIVLVLIALWPATATATAQVQVRVAGDGRATYSELHQALRGNSAAADSIRQIFRLTDTRRLWTMFTAALEGTGSWNEALLAATRLAMLRDPAASDSARALRGRVAAAGPFPIERNPGLKAEDIEPSLQAIVLERQREVSGDSAVLADILGRVPLKRYNHGDAWVLGRLGGGARDSVRARFLSADTEEFRVRYLTLLSYFTDPALVPFLARVYAAPDSFGIPKRYGMRASDGLLWIGTREAMTALLDARATARARRVYADSALWHGGYDFLAHDSSAVISRTGHWLTAWLHRLR